MAEDPSRKSAEQLVAALRDAARRAGLRRDDPLAPLIVTFIETIRFLSERTARSDRIITSASQRIAATVNQGRLTADAEAKRFRAELAKSEADIVQRIATDIAEAADESLTRRVRVLDRRTTMWAALTLFLVSAASMTVGAWWGRNRAYTHFHETEIGLHQAFLDGPDAAHAWRELMEWNDLRSALRACSDAGPDKIHVQGGRRWCWLPFWIERPLNPQQPQP